MERRRGELFGKLDDAIPVYTEDAEEVGFFVRIQKDIYIFVGYGENESFIFDTEGNKLITKQLEVDEGDSYYMLKDVSDFKEELRRFGYFLDFGI